MTGGPLSIRLPTARLVWLRVGMCAPATAARRESRGVDLAQVAVPSSRQSCRIGERSGMACFAIGADPHKRSKTIEIINEHEQVLGQGRFGTDATATKPCWPQAARTKTGFGLSRASTASVGTAVSALSPTAIPSSMYPQSCPPEPGLRHRPGPPDRPGPSLQPSPWWPGALTACGRSTSMTPPSRCGCSSTAVTSFAGRSHRNRLPAASLAA